MNRKSLRQYRKLRNSSRSVIWENPVLSQGLALPFAIAASTSLLHGLTLSVAMLAAILVPAIVYSYFGKRIAGWLRPVVYSLVNMGLVITFMSIISGYPAVIESLGIYLPMVAVNTITMRLVSDAVDAEKAVSEALLSWVGFAVAICLISFIREFLGSGTILGRPHGFDIQSLAPVLYPFSGFILVGFLAAGLRGLNRLVVRMLSRAKSREGGEVKA